MVVYLKEFQLLDENQEYKLINSEKRRIFNTPYPFLIFPEIQLEKIVFSPITLFYGGNGSGKSTLLNLIAKNIHAIYHNDFDKGTYFQMYVEHCRATFSSTTCKEIKLISSDDVFDYLLDIQSINSHVNRRKDELCQEYMDYRYHDSSLFVSDYDQLKKKVKANQKTMSAYVREGLGKNNIISQSNGETALLFFEKEIKEDAIYILDEPENSLSAKNQLKLKKFIEDSARFFHCQFIIATHSPFLLDLDYATIYDLDSTPATSKKWIELENIQLYYQFFKEHQDEFEPEN